MPRSVPYDLLEDSNTVPEVETDAGLIAYGQQSPFARTRSGSNPYNQRHARSCSHGQVAGQVGTHSHRYSFGSTSSASRLRNISTLRGDQETQHAPVFADTLSAEPSPNETEQDQAFLLSRKNLETANKHPRAAVVLGVSPRWLLPLHIVRACSCLPAAWWGFRCSLTFLAELILGVGRGTAEALADGDLVSGNSTVNACYSTAWMQAEWRFRMTEVFLAIMWCATGAYLSFFFADCLMTRWLVNYTPFATLMRLLTLNALIAYVSSLSMWLSGASEDPRMLLPAWVSIASVLTIIYHLTQRNINIRKETHASIHVFSYASFATTCALLFQLHLARDNDPVVPLFEIAKQSWEYVEAWRIGK